MAEKQEIEQESFIQKWAPYLVAGVLVVAVGFYISQFPGGLSAKQSTWGQFGDFVGGAVNPIIGFFTIWLLAVSLRQNHKALSQANTALTQAKAELELTREAIEKTAEVQTETENALKEQIEIARQARDINNAFSLFKVMTERRNLANDLVHSLTRGSADEARLQKARSDLNSFNAARRDMGEIMANEVDRLRKIHLTNSER